MLKLHGCKFGISNEPLALWNGCEIVEAMLVNLNNGKNISVSRERSTCKNNHRDARFVVWVFRFNIMYYFGFEIIKYGFLKIGVTFIALRKSPGV